MKSFIRLQPHSLMKSFTFFVWIVVLPFLGAAAEESLGFLQAHSLNHLALQAVNSTANELQCNCFDRDGSGCDPSNLCICKKGGYCFMDVVGSTLKNYGWDATCVKDASTPTSDIICTAKGASDIYADDWHISGRYMNVDDFRIGCSITHEKTFKGCFANSEIESQYVEITNERTALECRTNSIIAVGNIPDAGCCKFEGENLVRLGDVENCPSGDAQHGTSNRTPPAKVSMGVYSNNGETIYYEDEDVWNATARTGSAWVAGDKCTNPSSGGDCFCSSAINSSAIPSANHGCIVTTKGGSCTAGWNSCTCNLPNEGEICTCAAGKCVRTNDGRDVSKPYLDEYRFVGNYLDDAEERILPIHAFTSDYYMDARSCSIACGEDVKFFATQNGRECWCGDGENLERVGYYTGNSTLLKQCANGLDDSNNRCGGNLVNSVFERQANATFLFKGSFNDDEMDRALDGKTMKSSDMSNSLCSVFCADYTYFGLQGGNKTEISCWCGDNDDYDRHGRNDTEIIPFCPSPPEMCGGLYINAVYQRIRTEFIDFRHLIDGRYDIEAGGEWKKDVKANIMNVDACAILCKGYKHFTINTKNSGQLGHCKCFEAGWSYGKYMATNIANQNREICLGNRTQLCGNKAVDEMWTRDEL